MPFIHLKTNVKISDPKKTAIKSAFGSSITTIAGKTESWLMVELDGERTLYFQGDDAPCAIAEVSIYGSADERQLNELTGKICGIITRELDIDSERIYVKYTLTPDWGWNGSNF